MYSSTFRSLTALLNSSTISSKSKYPKSPPLDAVAESLEYFFANLENSFPSFNSEIIFSAFFLAFSSAFVFSLFVVF